MIDLDQDTAQDLADAAEEELFSAIRAVEQWDEPRARLVDHVLRQRVVRALTRRAGLEDQRRLADHVRRAVLPTRRPALDGQGAPWSVIWGAYAAVLDRSVAMLGARDPAGAMRRLHVERILQVVRAQPGIRQHALGDHLGLKKGNLTRVLNLMEDEALIERRQEGKENGLFLGPAALELLVPPPPPARSIVQPGGRHLSYSMN
jgi:hypothetical protein